jgi:hypothetical protein
MNRLTHAEIRQFLDGLWEVDMGGFYAAPNIRSVTLIDLTIAQAKAHLDSFLATIEREIDPASINVREDAFDDSTLPVTTITFEAQDETARNTH